MITLAVEHLYTRVSAAFVEDEINAVNVFGWREVSKHPDTLPRIVWVPGDAQGSLGELGGARHMDRGNEARAIANLTEMFTVHLIAFDPRDAESELAQYRVGRFLYEAWLVAVYRAAVGTFRVRSQTWVRGKTTDRSYGVVLRAVCQLDAPIIEALPDEPLVGDAYAGQSDGVPVTVTHDLEMELNDEVDDT